MEEIKNVKKRIKTFYFKKFKLRYLWKYYISLNNNYRNKFTFYILNIIFKNKITDWKIKNACADSNKMFANSKKMFANSIIYLKILFCMSKNNFACALICNPFAWNKFKFPIFKSTKLKYIKIHNFVIIKSKIN